MTDTVNPSRRSQRLPQMYYKLEIGWDLVKVELWQDRVFRPIVWQLPCQRIKPHPTRTSNVLQAWHWPKTPCQLSPKTSNCVSHNVYDSPLSTSHAAPDDSTKFVLAHEEWISWFHCQRKMTVDCLVWKPPFISTNASSGKRTVSKKKFEKTRCTPQRLVISLAGIRYGIPHTFGR